jgi:hypothetical protein
VSSVIKIVLLSNKLLKERCIPGRGMVNCACVVAGTVWIGAGHSIYKAAFWGGKLTVSLIAKSVHNRDVIVYIVYTGEGEVWCSTLHDKVSILDNRAKKANILTG